MADPLSLTQVTHLAATRTMGAGTSSASASGTAPGTKPAPESHEAKLRATATALEASFLQEMLKQAGLGKSRESFGGGVGEEQFSSFLVQEQATAMAKAGGIGLAESIFKSLNKGASDGQ